MVTIGIIDGKVMSTMDIANLDEQGLRDILVEMKHANQIIGEKIVEIVQSKEYLTFDQSKVITDEVKNGNFDKAIKSHRFFVDSTEEEAKAYVERVKENKDLFKTK